MNPSRFVLLSTLAVLLLLGGCATRPINPPITQADPSTGYRYETRQADFKDKSNLVILAFSGGGTRAAAFSYGVLEFLRRTEIVGPRGNRVRLLDEVDVITGVSGGSFTALAYGLYGEKLFAEYEQRFLKRDVQGEIISRTFSPSNWGRLSSTGWGRSELAAQLYDEILFNNATFGDLNRGKGPLILASATDISTGSRFVFNQRIFDIICSDLNAVPLSRAAAASSAVPVVLSPVTINNYGGTCNRTLPGLGEDLHRYRQPAATRRPGDTLAEGRGSVRRQRPSALPSPCRRRRVGQRGHAQCARYAGSARSLARSGSDDGARQRAQDHCVRRQFAVVAADEMGRVGDPARHGGHPAQVGGHPDRRLFLRGRRTVERHGGAVADRRA